MEVYKEWLEKAMKDMTSANLNPYYIGTRYPVGKKYTKEIAEEAIKNGEKVIEWVEKNLGK